MLGDISVEKQNPSFVLMEAARCLCQRDEPQHSQSAGSVGSLRDDKPQSCCARDCHGHCRGSGRMKAGPEAKR